MSTIKLSWGLMSYHRESGSHEAMHQVCICPRWPLGIPRWQKCLEAVSVTAQDTALCSRSPHPSSHRELPLIPTPGTQGQKPEKSTDAMPCTRHAARGPARGFTRAERGGTQFTGEQREAQGRAGIPTPLSGFQALPLGSAPGGLLCEEASSPSSQQVSAG